jgi:hypothetical protein
LEEYFIDLDYQKCEQEISDRKSLFGSNFQ